MLDPITILTLVHNRERALINQLQGIANNSQFPIEVIIVRMNEPSAPLPDLPFAVKQLRLDQDKGINLASARNYAMQHSRTDFNIFLDVDCVPSSTLITAYSATLPSSDNLVSGRVRYLSKKHTKALYPGKDLLSCSVADPVRSEDEDFTHELFWTLNFGCSKATFQHIGGFDEQYNGYGAEDTDFAFTARSQGIGILTLDAIAFHQYHPSYWPPLNHLESILKNAKLFFDKWATWPMEGWLQAFEELGYIQRQADDITLLRKPTAGEIARAIKK